MGRRLALIVANSEYEHSGLAQLRSPAADATALAEVLGDRRVSDFDVRIVRNETAHVVQEQVEDLFLEGEPDDLLLLHFSCHGVKSESGELYFAARNTRPHRLGSTAVPAEFVRRCMRVSRSRSIVLLLDCCYGGAFSEGVAVRASGDVHVLDSLPAGRGRAVITASTSMEYAFEGDQLAEEHVVRPSVFTSALVRGLSTGEADRDEDGLISLNELYDYVFEQVRHDNPNQTPSRDIEMQGELYVARSSRRRIKPAPMPSDLMAATVDPNMFTRLGAVAELRSRLSSSNLEVAAGAAEALLGMRTDIRAVADAAGLALEDVDVRPSVRELRFSSPEPQVVSLGGPPLARACTAVAVEDWIQVSQAGDQLTVSVHGAPEGVAHGQVTITGPAGEAVVTVLTALAPVAEVAPPMPVAAPLPEPVVASAQEPVVASVPAPQPEQAPASAPPAEPERFDQQVGWCAGLTLGAAAGLFLASFTDYKHGDTLYVSREAVLWYVVPMAIVALIAGACLVPARTRTIGLGMLMATAPLGAWGLGWQIGELAIYGSEAFYAAFWLMFAAELGLVAAAVIAVVAVHHDPDLTFWGAGERWRTPALGTCGLAVSALFVVLTSELVVAQSDGWNVVLAPVFTASTAWIAPVLAARARPYALSAAVVGTWIVLLLAVSMTYYTTFTGSLYLLWVPLLAALVITAVPRRVP